ncbi:MAG: preprotein translocase subunit SecG [Candidatus Daviesbacteria bacterium]|nr:preprotein translocase subunit SecG [Candidatus Daviesbacteria bacterium]
MKTSIYIVQIILGIVLILIIIIQQKGTGLGSGFGGGFSFYRTKRGAEKLLFKGTILFSLFFILLALLGLFI